MKVTAGEEPTNGKKSAIEEPFWEDSIENSLEKGVYSEFQLVETQGNKRAIVRNTSNTSIEGCVSV